MKSVFAFAFSLFLTVAASAQNYVYQSGGVTPNHAVRWITNGVIGDGGTAANGFLSSIGVLAQGPAICQQSAAPPSPYNQLCLGVNTAGAATISLQNYGGASPQNLNFVINGVTYPFPQSLNSLVIGGTAIINCSTNGYGFYNNNGILGCEPITASPGGSNTDLQYNSSGSFGGISGATSDGTNLTVGATNLRVLGSSTGYNTLETANAGASNYVTTFPAATDTVVELAQTQTLTNKTIASSTDVLGGVTLTLGSDATGDIYYRNSGGVLTRLGIGSTGNVLTVSGGLPAWESNTGNFVTTFSAGTTGFTPNSATSGAITLAGTLGVANGGTNANLTANAGGVVYSTSSALAILNNPNSNSECLLSGTSAPTWGSCSTGVASLGNASADTSLTIAGTGSGPWTGTVTAALNLGNTNTWTGPQTMSGSSGYWGCSGNNGSPSFSNGVGSVQCAAVDGLILRGQGSAYDIDIHNSGNTRVAAVPTGTQNFEILGGVFVGTSGTFGTQQTTQGSLVLANTAAGAYTTTIESSNSASASATYTLPTAPPAGNGYSLTATTAGVMSWVNAACTNAADVGFVGDGSTDNNTAWAAWWAALPTAGGCLQFGTGVFKIGSTNSLAMPNSAGWVTTSTTSVAIGATGSKTFTVASCAGVSNGDTVGAYNVTAGTNQGMTGAVTSCTGTTLVMTASALNPAGSTGTFANWQILKNQFATGFVSNVAIRGVSQDATEIYFPSGSAQTLQFSSQQQAIHFSDLSLTTGTTNAGPALALTNSYPFFGTFNAQSDFTNVTCRGHDGYAATDYWSACLTVANVSEIAFRNFNAYGDGSAAHGIGVQFSQAGAGCFTTPVTCGENYEFDGPNFSFLGVGIQYGLNTQSLTWRGGYCTQVTDCVVIPSSAGTVQVLNILGLTCFALDACVSGATSVPNLAIVGGYYNSTPNDYSIDILESEGSIASVSFSPRAVSPVGGIKIGSASSSSTSGLMTIENNQFASSGQAIFLNNTSNGGTVLVGPSNLYSGNTGNILNNYGGNQIFPGTRGLSSPSNPTGTSNTSGLMAGLAFSFTPSWSGNLSVNVKGFHTNSLASDGCVTQIRYGTGTAPSNNTALAGTTNGATTASTGGTALIPFTNIGYITGLTIGTQYWIDLSQAAVTAGTCSIGGLNVLAIEN